MKMMIDTIKISMFALAAFVGVEMSAKTVGEDVRTPDNRIVYEVNVRNFSNSAHLNGVTSALPRLKALGVTESPLGAIGDIEVDDPEADIEYYNLQGMRLDGPAHGIYIKRVRGKANIVYSK